NAKSVFPEDHPLALGAGARARPRTVDHFLNRADIVFGIGTSFTRSTYLATIPPGKTMVQIVNSAADINKDYPIAHAIIGDAKAVLHQMITEAKAQLGTARRDGTAVCKEIAGGKADFLQQWLPRLTANETPISPYRVIWDLLHTVDRSRTLVTHDAGNPRDQMTAFFETVIPHGYLGWGKTTQLGSGLGLALGAKLALPDALVVNVMGDAAFGMVGMDFETAVRMQIPILTIVMNNGAMGGYEKFMPLSTQRFRSKYLSGDMAAVAAGLGGYTERVTQPGEIVPALRRCIRETQMGRAALLEVMTREEAVFPLAADDKYQ
ncbi:MAG: thiamine pyrophosphate-dependent enzyme, partial [Chloroflexota bacterium]|nr:thiamine pyrophosphate-dependent enzyme [Chloroflexota bacterium]